jgi:hypothetical protein
MLWPIKLRQWDWVSLGTSDVNSASFSDMLECWKINDLENN